MMNKDQLLQLTTKEIESLLNENITTISIQSEDEAEIRRKMIDSVVDLFDESIGVSIPYYTNTEITFTVGNVSISFKVSTKKTGKTVQVSRLRKKDIKTIGKFKFKDIFVSFWAPFFDEDIMEKFTVRLSRGVVSGPSISLKHRKEQLINILTKEVFIEEIQKQDPDWVDIRKNIILYAAQPNIKSQYFEPDFNQEKWNHILQKTEEANKELIDQEIEKMLNVLN